MTKDQFQKNYSIDMSENIEKKKQGNGLELSYLSWSYAWANAHNIDPEFIYTPIYWDEAGNENTDRRGNRFHCVPGVGYEVGCEIHMLGTTRREYLPVLDNSNLPLYDHPYTYQKWNNKKNGYDTKTIPAATIMDINTATKRVMVKCFALFGIGLSIYAGEDIPKDLASWDDEDKPNQQPQKPQQKKAPANPQKAAEPGMSNQEKMKAAKLFLANNDKAKAGYESIMQKTQDQFSEQDWVSIYNNLEKNGALTKQPA